MASVRRGGQQTQGGFCPLCGGGRSKGGGWWKWIVGGFIVYALVQSNSGGDSGSSTDYKPPSQTQQDAKKCDPDALLQFGCTP